MEESPGQSRLHSKIFPQIEPFPSCSPRQTEFNRFLSCPDSISRCGVPGLRSRRRLGHGGSLSDVERKDISGRVVQPGDGENDSGTSRSRGFTLASVHGAVQRRCCALSGGYGRTRNVGKALTLARAPSKRGDLVRDLWGPTAAELDRPVCGTKRGVRRTLPVALGDAAFLLCQRPQESLLLPWLRPGR